MNCRKLLLSLALVSSSLSIFADGFDVLRNDVKEVGDCFDINNQMLSIQCLCANTIKARGVFGKKGCFTWLSANHLRAEDAAFNTSCTKTANAEIINANTINVKDLNACNVNAIKTTNLCSDSIQTTDLCVKGNIKHCMKYKAYLSITGVPVNPYTLGTVIDFDTIEDDPNGNATIGAGAKYTAPVNGYYMVTFGSGLNSILPGGPVLSGIPVTRPQVIVNGTPILKAFDSFLSFDGPFQNSVLSGLIYLEAGDVVQATLEIYYIDPVTGIGSYAGNVDLASGITNTYMIVHYLSSDCDTLECPPCIPTIPPVGGPCSTEPITCAQFTVNCDCTPTPTIPNCCVTPNNDGF